MATVAKLKEQARAFEQRDQWREALDAYRQAAEEAAGEDADIALWNRIGDLHLRVGEADRAVEAYDRAVDAYADAGLHNNAIALCRKVLRIAPARTAVYLKLGQISAAQGFLADARQNFLEYATRMQRAGQLDASFAALKEFADLSPDDTDVRILLADQLRSHGRADDAVEQLRVVLAHLREAGPQDRAEDVEQRILAIDPDADLAALPAARGGAAEAQDRGLSLDFYGAVEPGDVVPEAAGAEPLPGLDLPLVGSDEGPGGVAPLAGLETSALDGLEPTHAPAAPAAGGDADDGLPFMDPGFEIEHTSLAGAEPEAEPHDAAPELPLLLPDEEDENEDDEEGEPLPLLDDDGALDPVGLPMLDPAPLVAAPFSPTLFPPPFVPARDPVDELRERIAAAPEDTASLHRLVDLLEDRGLAADAANVLTEAHRALGARGAYRDAIDAVRSLLARRPDDTALYQKQVEYAFRAGDAPAMVRAYLDLGRHLGSPGENAKSRAVYQRVLELDAANEEARRALAPPPPPPAAPRPAAPAAPAAPAGDYVDLGSLIMEDEPEERSTRFVVEEEEPTGDEDRDFADMLSVFRQKVSENIGADDPSSHYDLGVAFMEMGLIDEAIAEFQVALRGGANPLATLELLGTCFVEKGQYPVAARVLDRALRLPGTEAEVVGVAYQLGRCQEALGNPAAARELYERVLAFDIRFRDAASRLESLRAPTGPGF